MESTVQIAARIRRLQAEVSSTEERSRGVRRQLDDLRDFQGRHERTVSQLQQDLSARRSQLNGVSLDPVKVRSFSQYRSAMSGILDQSHAHLAQCEEQRRAILRAINAKTNEADDLAKQQRNLQYQLDDARRDLRRAQEREASSV